MAGFRNSGTIDVVYADNVDFTGATIPSPTMVTNGQLLIASTAAPNIKVGTLTSPSGTLTIGYSSPNITLDLAGGSLAVDSFQPDTGTNPVVPNASGLVAIRGQTVPNVSGIQVTGALNELDIAMFSPFAGGFTFSNSVSGGDVQLMVANPSNTANSNPSLAIISGGATGGHPYIYLSTTHTTDYALGSLVIGAADNFRIATNPDLVTGLFFEATAAGAITFANAYTFPTADGTAGQVLTTNGAGQLSFASSGAGSWSVIGSSQTLAVNQGYICTSGAGLSLALPATSAVGDTIEVALDGSTSWTITQPNAGTQIRIGSAQTTLGVGGSLASTAVGDSIKLVCETANARWIVISMVGNITVV